MTLRLALQITGDATGARQAAAEAESAVVKLGKTAEMSSAQTMALQHAIRGMSEQLLLGVSPAQALTAQMGHLSFALSGPGGLKAAAAGIATALVNPMNLAIIGFGLAATAAGALFSAVSDGAGRAESALKHHRDLIDEIKKSYEGAAKGLGEFGNAHRLQQLLDSQLDRPVLELQGRQLRGAIGGDLGGFMQGLLGRQARGALDIGGATGPFSDMLAAVRQFQTQGGSAEELAGAIRRIATDAPDSAEGLRKIAQEFLSLVEPLAENERDIRENAAAQKLLKGATDPATKSVLGLRDAVAGLGAAAGAAGNSRQQIFGYDYIRANTTQVPGSSFEHGLSSAPDKYQSLIKMAADESKVSADLIAAIIYQESRYNPNAVSPKGARGLGQFMPGTAADLGVDPSNVQSSIFGVGKYVRRLKDMFGGDDQLALLAYNWGPGNVKNWLASGADPSRVPGESSKYVSSILGPAVRGGSVIGPELALARKAETKEINDALKEQQQLFDDLRDSARGFASDFAQGMLDGKSAAESLNSALKNLASRGLDLGLNTIFDALLGKQGSPGGGALGSLLGGLFADGGAFDRGHVTAFASGGVVDRPGYFNIGLMGESGPEAIMPLTRMPGGKLGVRAQGGGGTTVIQYISTPSPQAFREDRHKAGRAGARLLNEFSRRHS
jgi:soluble lytic murein transglycosylase-like protein